MTQVNTAIHVTNACKAFQKNRQALSAIDLTIEQGQCVGLLGASGSGKSTLLRCINLLESIDDGQICLDGKEISDPFVNVDEVRRRLGMVFQSFNLSTCYPPLS